MVAAVVGVILISPPVIFVDPDYALLDWLVPRVLISHYFFGGLVILGLLLESRWRLETAGEPEESVAVSRDSSRGMAAVTVATTADATSERA